MARRTRQQRQSVQRYATGLRTNPRVDRPRVVRRVVLIPNLVEPAIGMRQTSLELLQGLSRDAHFIGTEGYGG